MASPGTVSFKAYLREKGSTSSKEVRRFGMEQTEVVSYNRLKTKLQQVFPSLAGRSFVVNWKDEDGDDIIISSDDELLTALTENNDQIRRLYLDVYKSPTVSFQPFEVKGIDTYLDVGIPMVIGASDEAGSGGEEDDVTPAESGKHSAWYNTVPNEHFRVICDGCNNKITTHRYKCVECSDFDLCLTCESRGLHSNHIMTRIPLTNSFATRHPHFLKGLNSLSDAVRKMQHRRRKNERRCSRPAANPHDLYKMANNYFMGFEKCMPERKSSNPEKRGKKDHCHSSFSATKETCGGASTSQVPPTPQNATEAEPSTCDNQSAFKGTCPATAGLIGSFLNKENMNAIQRFLEQISPVPEQLLQEVARSLAGTTLNDDPAPASNQTSTPSTSNASNQAEFASNLGSSNPGPSHSVPSSAGPSAPVDSTPAALSSGSSASQPPVEILIPISMESSPVVQSPRSGSAEPDTEGWMVVEPQVHDGQNDQSAVYPKLPSVEPTPVAVPPQSVPNFPRQPVHHLDGAVKICLERLKLMGYNVDDQFIVEMVEANRGDLSRVLDLLG